jgi:vitamin B12 transporter
LTAGIRYDNHSQTESSTTYRIAPAYVIDSTGTKIKATWGTGFKAPSLYQLYAPATLFGPAGNENLKPEKSSGWDLGVEQSFSNDALKFGFTYFSNTFADLIDYDFSQGYINISNASTKGAEITLMARPVTTLSFLTTYTRTEAKNTGTGEYLLRRPKDKFTARLDWEFSSGANIHLSLIYVGEREDLYWLDWAPTPVTLESYTLVNAAGYYEVIQSLEIFLRLDNILDSDYETIKGFGTPGFSVYGGVKARF